MFIRSWLLLGYCVSLLAFTFLITSRAPQSPLGLVVSRKLEANRLLQLGDLSPMQAGGQYLTRSVSAGEALKPGDITTFPSLSLSEGEWPFALPTKRDLVTTGGVNAGTQVHICKGEEVVISSAPVRTVFCPASAGDCIAIVVLASPKADDVSKVFGKGNEPFLRPAALNAACK